jgi:NADH-quinone oxidoreductase subunit G
VITLNARTTKTDLDAAYALRYPYGNAAAATLAMVNALSAKRPDLPEAVNELARSSELKAAAQAFAAAKDAVIIYGSDGMGLPETRALAQACTNLLLATNHYGRENNGLLGAWPRANDMGAWELGWRPSANLQADLEQAGALYIVAADPVGDDPAYQSVFGGEKFVVVQDLYLTQTARLADVVFPAQSFTEREGTYTNGERRVQRFYTAIQATLVPGVKVDAPGTRHSAVLTSLDPLLEGPQADYAIPALIAERLGQNDYAAVSASLVFDRLAADTPTFRGLNYRKLAEVHEQWPIVGRSDMYYGGTGYGNHQGLGVQLAAASGGNLLAWPQVVDFRLPRLGAMAFPVTRLYDCGSTMKHAELLDTRIGDPFVVISASEAARLKVEQSGILRVVFSDNGQSAAVKARVDDDLPERVVLIPRSFGIPISGPTPVELKPAG